MPSHLHYIYCSTYVNTFLRIWSYNKYIEFSKLMFVKDPRQETDF